MQNRKFMKSLQAFKSFMLGPDAPNWVARYCGCLDKYEWMWFYEQMKEPTEFANVEWLFYVLKWILKHDFDDLSREVFFQYVLDPEMCYGVTIKDEWLDCLKVRYGKELEEVLFGLDACNDLFSEPAVDICAPCQTDGLIPF